MLTEEEKEIKEIDDRIKDTQISNIVLELEFYEKLYLYFGDNWTIHKTVIERKRNHLRNLVAKNILENNTKE